MKAIVSILLFAVLTLQPLFAQQGEKSGSDVYSRIEKMISKQRYTDAYNAADSLRAAAMSRARAGQAVEAVSRQLLTSTWYMERAAINYQEDAADSSLARFRAILPSHTRGPHAVPHFPRQHRLGADGYGGLAQGAEHTNSRFLLRTEGSPVQHHSYDVRPVDAVGHKQCAAEKEDRVARPTDFMVQKQTLKGEYQSFIV